MSDAALRWSPMRVTVRQAEPAAQADLLRLAESVAPDPEVFDLHPPFFFRATISIGVMDAYGTVMRISSLQNYAQDAGAGVAVLNSHDTGQLPIGRSVAGAFTNNRRGHPANTVADAYVLSGWSNGVVNSDDVINGIRGGVLRDVSIGFHGGRIVCSICNSDMFGFRVNCPHFPGVAYDVEGEQEPITAIGMVEDARLSEFSIVYDGACPGAMIEKATRMIEAGVLSRKQAELLDTRFRMRLILPQVFTFATGHGSDGTIQYPSPEPIEQPPAAPIPTLSSMENATPPGTSDVEDGMTEPIPVSVEELRAALTRVGAPENATADWLAGEILRLRPLADVGVAYRQDLIDQALEEGVRAKGVKFPTEQWRGMLQKLELEEIKLHRSAWQADADAAFTKGRQTQPDESPAPIDPPNTRSVALPDLAYRAY